jgi:hypothetical protein
LFQSQQIENIQPIGRITERKNKVIHVLPNRG